MFKWNHEIFFEVNLSLESAWDFLCTPANWTLWNAQFQSCTLAGEFQTGGKVKIKPKVSLGSFVANLTDVQLHQRFEYDLRAFGLRQTSLAVFQEISPQKTLIFCRTNASGFLVPFFKQTMARNFEKAFSKCQEVLNSRTP